MHQNKYHYWILIKINFVIIKGRVLMNMISKSFDPKLVEWRNVKDPENKEFKVDFDYSLLGYDIKSGRLDMLLICY